jgi:hypothetical protein
MPMETWIETGGAWLGQAAGAAGPLQVWILPALLGFGLAAASGLRAFLPLLMLGLASRFGLFGLQLHPEMQWLVSDAALAALGVAAAVELLGDKIPLVDNLLQSAGLLVRPLAAAVAAGSVFWAIDPVAAAVAGVIVGTPTALAMAGASTGVRAASTLATGGLANPALSLAEDLGVAGLVVAALLAPLLVPLLVLALLAALLNGRRRLRRRRAVAAAAEAG